MRFYTNPSREGDKWSLPDAEVFHMSDEDIANLDASDRYDGEGWYVWACFPGCMPDGDPWGPFDSKEDAIKDWRAHFADEEDDEDTEDSEGA